MSYRYFNEYRDKTFSYIYALISSSYNKNNNSINNSSNKLTHEICEIDNNIDKLRFQNLKMNLDDLYYGYYSYEQIKNTGEYFIYKDINGEQIIVSSVSKNRNMDEIRKHLKDIKCAGIVKEFIERKEYKFTSYLEHLNKLKNFIE